MIIPSSQKKSVHPLLIIFYIALPYFRNREREHWMVPIPKQHWHIQLLEVLCDNIFYIVTVFCLSVVITTCYKLVTSWKHTFFVFFFLMSDANLREPRYWYRHKVFIFKNNWACPTPVAVVLVLNNGIIKFKQCSNHKIARMLVIQCFFLLLLWSSCHSSSAVLIRILAFLLLDLHYQQEVLG